MLQPDGIYPSFYAEAQCFVHLHVHLIPRYADTPPDRRGPWIFAYMRERQATARNEEKIAAAARSAAAIHRLLAGQVRELTGCTSPHDRPSAS